MRLCGPSRRHVDDQVRQLKASVLQMLADERIGFANMDSAANLPNAAVRGRRAPRPEGMW
jgi:hypothetical protein